MNILPPSFKFDGDKDKAISLKAYAGQFYNLITRQAAKEGLPFINRTKRFPDGTIIKFSAQKNSNFKNWSGKVSIFATPLPSSLGKLRPIPYINCSMGVANPDAPTTAFFGYSSITPSGTILNSSKYFKSRFPSAHTLVLDPIYTTQEYTTSTKPVTEDVCTSYNYDAQGNLINFTGIQNYPISINTSNTNNVNKPTGLIAYNNQRYKYPTAPVVFDARVASDKVLISANRTTLGTNLSVFVEQTPAGQSSTTLSKVLIDLSLTTSTVTINGTGYPLGSTASFNVFSDAKIKPDCSEISILIDRQLPSNAWSTIDITIPIIKDTVTGDPTKYFYTIDTPVLTEYVEKVGYKYNVDTVIDSPSAVTTHNATQKFLTTADAVGSSLTYAGYWSTNEHHVFWEDEIADFETRLPYYSYPNNLPISNGSTDSHIDAFLRTIVYTYNSFVLTTGTDGFGDYVLIGWNVSETIDGVPSTTQDRVVKRYRKTAVLRKTAADAHTTSTVRRDPSNYYRRIGYHYISDINDVNYQRRDWVFFGIKSTDVITLQVNYQSRSYTLIDEANSSVTSLIPAFLNSTGLSDKVPDLLALIEPNLKTDTFTTTGDLSFGIYVGPDFTSSEFISYAGPFYKITDATALSLEERTTYGLKKASASGDYFYLNVYSRYDTRLSKDPTTSTISSSPLLRYEQNFGTGTYGEWGPDGYYPDNRTGIFSLAIENYAHFTPYTVTVGDDTHAESIGQKATFYDVLYKYICKDGVVYPISFDYSATGQVTQIPPSATTAPSSNSSSEFFEYYRGSETRGGTGFMYELAPNKHILGSCSQNLLVTVSSGNIREKASSIHILDDTFSILSSVTSIETSLGPITVGDNVLYMGLSH